jgi:hypothetical protein
MLPADGFGNLFWKQPHSQHQCLLFQTRSEQKGQAAASNLDRSRLAQVLVDVILFCGE